VAVLAAIIARESIVLADAINAPKNHCREETFSPGFFKPEK
jgi:hypothetical protein